jgi:hypothetical protein
MKNEDEEINKIIQEQRQRINAIQEDVEGLGKQKNDSTNKLTEQTSEEVYARNLSHCRGSDYWYRPHYSTEDITL